MMCKWNFCLNPRVRFTSSVTILGITDELSHIKGRSNQGETAAMRETMKLIPLVGRFCSQQEAGRGRLHMSS